MNSACAVVLLLAASAAWAGRPFVTEDAGVITAGECELETFLSRTTMRDEASTRGGWIQPGCGVGLATQLSIGAGRSRSGIERETQAALTGKTALRALTDEQAGVTIAYSISGRRARGVSFKHDATAVAAVVSLPVEKDLLVHANFGWQRAEKDRRNTGVWATAIESLSVWPDLDVGAEVFGDSRTAGVYVGAGARYALKPERVFVDASWARQSARARGTLATIGVKLTF